MLFGFGKKKETPEEREARRRKIDEEMQQKINRGNEEYDRICAQVGEILTSAEKPRECNVVCFASAPYLFPQLQSYQYYTDWEIWKNGDYLYIYCAEVENYPEQHFGADAPAIAQIPISTIQHFRIEGTTYTETKISGGTVTQNRHTGRIKQTAIKSNTIQRDNRIIRLSVVENGVVKNLDFLYAAYDIFCALIPEKEH